MVPISALRETIVLVIFGIVLVPIAAKRAQDAPGYWKAFAGNAQQSLIYHDPQPPTPALMLTTNRDDAVSSSLATYPYTVRNGTASLVSVAIKPRPDSKGSLTFRLRLSKSGEATHATTTQVVALLEAAKISKRGVPAVVDGAVPPTAVTTSAANRERWTLIWMGTAIAAVAIFMMSFC